MSNGIDRKARDLVSSRFFFILAIVFSADFLFGFVYGYMADKPNARLADPPQPAPSISSPVIAHAPKPPPPRITVAPSSQFDPLTPGKELPEYGVLGIADEPDPADETQPAAPDTAASKEPGDTAPAPTLNDVATQPASPGAGTQHPEPETKTQPVNPETELFSDLFKPPQPIERGEPQSAEVREADDLMIKAQAMVDKFRKSGSQKDMKEARKLVENAVELYRTAAEAAPKDKSVKDRLDAAKRWLHAAMKSSGF